MTVLTVIIAIAIGYLCGSVPFGLVITRLAGTQDLRTIGSGNIGATNVLRTGRKGLAAATLLLDMLKGTVAILIVNSLYHVAELNLIAAAAAFFGHLYPVWLNFRGGKGVATFLGCLLGIHWPAALVFAAVWLALAYLFRYSSLSALVASATSALSLALFSLGQACVVFLVLAAVLWWKHSDNIRRLLAGSEGKIGQK